MRLSVDTMYRFLHERLSRLRYVRKQKWACKPKTSLQVLAATCIVASQFSLIACRGGSTQITSSTTGIFLLHQQGIIKLDAHTHEVLWQTGPELKGLDFVILTDHLASDGEHLYVSGYLQEELKPSKHMVYAYDGHDGHLIWSKNFLAYTYYSEEGSPI